MEFDASTRFDIDRDPDTLRLRERIAAKREEIEKYCAQMRRGGARRLADRDRAALMEAARRANLDPREYLTRIAERALDLRRLNGDRGVDAIIMSIEDIGREREREARRRALRGTVAFDRAETRDRAANGAPPW